MPPFLARGSRALAEPARSMALPHLGALAGERAQNEMPGMLRTLCC